MKRKTGNGFGRATVFIILSLLCVQSTQGQRRPGDALPDKTPVEECPEPAPQSSGAHHFRRPGETLEIPLKLADCQAVGLILHWSNGRNNGSMFNVIFRDNDDRPVYTKQFSGFSRRTVELPISNFYIRPHWGSSALISVPASVTIQTAAPFALPVGLTYTVTRVGRSPKKEKKAESRLGRNEVVRIQTAARLIGASRLALIQMELKTDQPFPLRHEALKLQIGKRVFVDELSGEHTGRTLKLSLTPEMFAELQDGDEIMAFFDKQDREVWNFGKLDKSLLDK